MHSDSILHGDEEAESIAKGLVVRVTIYGDRSYTIEAASWKEHPLLLQLHSKSRRGIRRGGEGRGRGLVSSPDSLASFKRLPRLTSMWTGWERDYIEEKTSLPISSSLCLTPFNAASSVLCSLGVSEATN